MKKIVLAEKNMCLDEKYSFIHARMFNLIFPSFFSTFNLIKLWMTY